MGVLFGGQTGQEKQLSGQFQSLMPTLTSDINLQQARGGKTTKQGTKGLLDVQNFFKTLLSGDRAAVAQTLSPEIQAIKDQYDATKRSISNLGPRSGSTAASENQLAVKEAGDIGQLFTGARQRGAQGVLGTSEALASIGLSQSQLGASELGTAFQSLLGQQNIAGSQAQRQQEALGGIGELAGTLAMLAFV